MSEKDSDHIADVINKIHKEMSSDNSKVVVGKIDIQVVIKTYYDYLKSKDKNNLELERINSIKCVVIGVLELTLVLMILFFILFIMNMFFK